MATTGLAHIVFFTLKQSSDEAISRLTEACHKFLSGHDGCVHFSVGTLTADLERPVNDRDFHVALHVVFDSRAAHDAYQVAPRHLEFIAEQKENWETVRVFDSDVTQ
jgi:quinol monooxygenase YgiN